MPALFTIALADANGRQFGQSPSNDFCTFTHQSHLMSQSTSSTWTTTASKAIWSSHRSTSSAWRSRIRKQKHTSSMRQMPIRSTFGSPLSIGLRRSAKCQKRLCRRKFSKISSACATQGNRSRHGLSSLLKEDKGGVFGLFQLELKIFIACPFPPVYPLLYSFVDLS